LSKILDLNRKHVGVQLELSDIQLIEKVQEGDLSAFEIIMSRHKPKVAAVIMGMLGDADATEDVGQEVFIRFFRTIDKFKGDSELSTYLIRIAINLSINEINKRKRRHFVSFDDLYTSDSSDPHDRENSPDNRDLREILDRAIQTLDSKYRKVIVLRLVNGYSTKETAEILDLPLGTVLSRLARGQKKLQEILKPFYNNEATHLNTL